jgi:HEAT repeat protein
VAAATVLARIGPPAAAAVPALLVASLDVLDEVRDAARQALNAIDPQWHRHEGLAAVLPAVADKLGDSRDPVVEAASLALIRVGAAAVPALAAALGEQGQASRLDYRRLWAARTLGRLGAAAAPALPHLIRLLECGPQFVRQAALEALGQIGPTTPELVPALIGYLGHNFADIRKATCGILGRMGHGAEPAVAALIETLGDPDEATRQAAVESLTRLGEVAVPCLRQALADHAGAVRKAKELALKQLPEVALRSFFAELDRWHRIARDRAREILSRVAPEEAAPVTTLVRVLHVTSYEAGYRFGAEKEDGGIEGYWVEMHELIRGSEEFRESVHSAMAELARSAVPKLIALTRREKWRERLHAIAELARFGWLASEALPVLEELEHDPDERIRQVAGMAHYYIRKERFMGFG